MLAVCALSVFPNPVSISHANPESGSLSLALSLYQWKIHSFSIRSIAPFFSLTILDLSSSRTLLRKIMIYAILFVVCCDMFRQLNRSYFVNLWKTLSIFPQLRLDGFSLYFVKTRHFSTYSLVFLSWLSFTANIAALQTEFFAFL